MSPTSISVPENGTNTFGVKLVTAPSSNVTVTIARQSGDTDLSANVSSLTFTPANWNIEQTVTIAAADDADTTNGTAIFAIASSGLPTQTVSATEIDDDTATAPTTVTINAQSAAYVRDGSYSGNNFGNDTSLVVKQSPNAGNTRNTYIKFDLTGVTGTITNGKVRVYGKLSGSGTVPIQIRGTDNSWVESSIKFDNAPAGVGSALSTATVNSTTAKWYELDVTSFLQSEQAAGTDDCGFCDRSHGGERSVGELQLRRSLEQSAGDRRDLGRGLGAAGTGRLGNGG